MPAATRGPRGTRELTRALAHTRTDALIAKRGRALRQFIHSARVSEPPRHRKQHIDRHTKDDEYHWRRPSVSKEAVPLGRHTGAVRQVLPVFRGYRQQDAQEFFCYLLDYLHRELARTQCEPL